MEDPKARAASWCLALCFCCFGSHSWKMVLLFSLALTVFGLGRQIRARSNIMLCMLLPAVSSSLAECWAWLVSEAGALPCSCPGLGDKANAWLCSSWDACCNFQVSFNCASSCCSVLQAAVVRQGCWLSWTDARLPLLPRCQSGGLYLVKGFC